MPDQAQEKVTAAALVIEDIHNDAGIEKVGGHLPVETLTEQLITLFAKMLNPASGATLSLRLEYETHFGRVCRPSDRCRLPALRE